MPGYYPRRAKLVSKAEVQRRQRQSRKDKEQNSSRGVNELASLAASLKSLAISPPVPPPLKRKAKRKSGRGPNSSSGAFQTSGAVGRNVRWKLFSAEKTRVHECIAFKMLRFVPANPAGSTGAFGGLDFGQGLITNDTYLLAVPWFRPSSFCIFHKHLTGPGKIDTTDATPGTYDAASAGDAGIWKQSPDPVKYNLGLPETRYRISHAYLTIQVVAASSITGDLILQHATPRLLDFNVTSIPEALRTERHSCVRLPLAGGWQKTFLFPLLQPEHYGEFSKYLYNTLTLGSEPFGPIFIGFDGVNYSEFVTPPSLKVSVVTMLEEELDLTINDLACGTKQKSLVDSRTAAEKAGGIHKGKNTKGDVCKAHGQHGHNG